jgi:hypothetical protein
MLKLFFCLWCSLSVSAVVAKTEPLEQNPGLKRFDTNETLGAKSQFDIRDVRIGDNVLVKANEFQQQGGHVHYISKGNRSRRVQISFYQPFLNTRLDQQFQLEFNRDNGFIHTILANYKLDSAYADITPVYQQVFEKAIAKYGEPLSLKDVQSLAKSNKSRVKLERFNQNISPAKHVSEDVKAYFSKLIITPQTGFVADENNRALLHSGFNECYLWQKSEFSEILTLCAFGKNSGNMKAQGIELRLIDFSTALKIKNYVKQPKNTPEITL